MKIDYTGIHTWKYGFWFRIKGYGLSCSDTNEFLPLFSERNGYRKNITIFGYRFNLLTPNMFKEKKSVSKT